MTFRDHLNALFAVIRDEQPLKYGEIARLVGEKRIVITDGLDGALVLVQRGTLVARHGDMETAAGRFTPDGATALIDGTLTTAEAIRRGVLDCTGSVADITLFFVILSIVVFASGRSVRAAALWRQYRATTQVGAEIQSE
jgi:hypothetical protein